MELLIQILHVATCLSLVAIVLLQHGKGADIGVQFGGGASQTVFGARGAGNFLTKLTTGAAIVFMVTSLVLSRMSGSGAYEDILDASAAEAPAAAEIPESSIEAVPLEDAPETGGMPGFEIIEPPATDAPADRVAPPAPAPADG